MVIQPITDLVDKNIITKEGSENIKKYYGTSFVDKKNGVMIGFDNIPIKEYIKKKDVK